MHTSSLKEINKVTGRFLSRFLRGNIFHISRVCIGKCCVIILEQNKNLFSFFLDEIYSALLSKDSPRFHSRSFEFEIRILSSFLLHSHANEAFESYFQHASRLHALECFWNLFKRFLRMNEKRIQKVCCDSTTIYANCIQGQWKMCFHHKIYKFFARLKQMVSKTGILIFGFSVASKEII